jgi:hypothetical protein
VFVEDTVSSQVYLNILENGCSLSYGLHCWYWQGLVPTRWFQGLIQFFLRGNRVPLHRFPCMFIVVVSIGHHWHQI